MSPRPGIQSKDVSATLIVSAFVLQLFFFAPLQVIVLNFGEFSVGFTRVALIHLSLSIGLIVSLCLLVRIFRIRILLPILTFLSLVAFLESRFFLSFSRHLPFDGKPIDWESLRWLSYVELGAVLVLGAMFVVFHKRTQLLSYASLFIIVFLSFGLFHAVVSNLGALLPNRQTSKTDSAYFDEFYRISRKRNVVHIVPDQTQGAMLHDILLLDHEHYAKVFDGFTLFTQAVGRYEGTYPSVVFYMAGEAPEPKYDLVSSQPYTWDYIEDTLRERSIITALSRSAFKTFGFQFHAGIFCKGPYTACTGTHDEVFGGVALRNPGSRVTSTILTALDLAFFQLSPVVLREWIYDEGRWLTKKLVKSANTHSGILDMFTEKMQVGNDPGSYNYFHHAGAHAPLLFDRNCKYLGPQTINWQNQREQVMCTLAQIEKMIQSIKMTGVYDQTMIVINGDHGTPWLPKSYPVRSGEVIAQSLIGTASTLVLIKPPDVRGPLSFSSRPVTTGDIPATIADAFGLDTVFPGIPMFGTGFVTDRERQYYTYESPAKAHNLQALKNMTRYRIRGDVFDERNWVVRNYSSSGDHPSQLRMDDAEIQSYSQGLSVLEHHGTPMRWADGKRVRVSLLPPPQGQVSLVFESYVPPFIEGQWMEISVKGRIIAKLDEKQLRGQRHIVPLPHNLPRTEVLEIEFNIGKTWSSKEDPRHLSILFKYIGLEPTG